MARDGARGARPGRRRHGARVRARPAPVVAGIVKDVAEELGNTPAVARSSYIDPRLFDLWERGETIGSTRSQTRAEREVLELLG